MIAPTRSRDDQRSKVYAAEQSLRWIYNHALDSGLVELSGVSLQLEPEARFGDLASVQAYVDRVTMMPAVVALFGITGKVVVRERRGSKFAHYQAGEIAIHTEGNNSARWAMREIVVLHELAHHYSRGHQHGPVFTAAYTDLVDIVMGPQAALALRLLYQQEGVE